MSPKKLSAKEKIENALIVYMEQGKLSEVTVAELIQKAGVGKSTFYRNYHDVYDVFEGMLGDFIEKIIYAVDVLMEAADVLSEELFFEYIKNVMSDAENFISKEERILIKYAIKNNDSFVVFSIIKVLCRKCKDYVLSHGMDETKASVYSQFAISSIVMEFIRGYIDNVPNCFYSIYYSAELFQKTFKRKEYCDDNLGIQNS